MNTAINIAEAVKDLLVAAAYDAVRAYRPSYALRDLDNTRLTVAVRDIEQALESRGSDATEVAIDIAVQRRVDVDNLAELDAMAAIVADVAGVLNRHDFEALGAKWIGSAITPAMPEHLDQYRCFTSIITCRYRVSA